MTRLVIWLYHPIFPLKGRVFMKRILALLLAVTLILSTIVACGSTGGVAISTPILEAGDTPIATRIFHTPTALTAAAASTIPRFEDHSFSEEMLIPRDGYVLTPTMYGLTGIDTLSAFFLKTPHDIPPTLSIDGQPSPTVVRQEANTFFVTPAIPLRSNSVYVFRLERTDRPDITWAFQTSVRFEITSTLPRNQAIHVPVRTGIEINFSTGNQGEINIEDYFSIYPYVEGRFIYRDAIAIFMPTDALDYQQIYTVTIGAGVGLVGTSEATTADYVFSFETELEADASRGDHWFPSVHFSQQYVDFPSFAVPSVSFWFNYNRDRARPAITMNIYRFDDTAQAIAAINGFAEVPFWAHNSLRDRFVDTSTLSQVSSTTVRTSREDNWWGETFTFPNALPPGFYVLHAVTEDSDNQMIIQITDLAVQVIGDNNMSLLWVNDMHTGLPVANANIYDGVTGTTYETSDYGIAVINRMLTTGEHVIITTEYDMENVVFVHSGAFQSFHNTGGWWGDAPITRSMSWDWAPSPWVNTQANNNYWTALQLDRTLFQRSDTLSFWGFIQNRRLEENITFVTATITEHSWWHYPERDTLHRQNIPVQYGAYSGEIRLPHLDPGSYELAIYHGGTAVSSIFFTVMDYEKPPYQLTVRADRVAAFLGDRVEFTASAEFFEGTPVADLEIHYWLWGHQLQTPTGAGGFRANLGLDGTYILPVEIAASDADAQGQVSLEFGAEATLPEIGWVHESANVRVFINDIHVRPRATRDGENASLNVNIQAITIDRLNDGTAIHGGDFLCAPVAGQHLSVDIYRIYWERVRDGERYDFVTRQVVPRYRHVRREQRLQQFNLTTNENGEASRDFQVPNNRNESYEARITTTDGNGRTIRHYAFIGRDWSSFHRNASDDMPFLYGARPRDEGYDIGDKVELTIMSGTEPVTRGNFLFVVVHDGILSYHVGENALAFTFDEQHVPNTSVFAYHFNGHTYHTGGQMRANLHFNSANRNMILDISACQESYKPGDMSTITITATDLDGNPKAANINISLVDEALFALMDYTVDTLAMLYGSISNNLQVSMATHATFISDGIEMEESAARQMYGFAATADMAAAAPATESDAAWAGGGDQARIRERFEDTAIFRSLRTNAQGQVSFTFQLPDNITSWRMTASGISTDLYAGNDVQNIRVTKPMFLHYTLNRIFLTGDVPSIGVNVFGTSLSGGELVTFEVWCENTPEDIRTATGAAFERVNIPLWKMTDSGSLIVRATVSNGYNDAVRHSYQVVNSHRQIDTAIFYDVTQNTVFEINPQGLTNITFTDHGRGQFLHTLMGMRWTRGARIEGLVARREATRLIETHFPDVALFGHTSTEFNIQDYQMENGGIAMLPYANANLNTTVMLMPFIMDEMNVHSLRRYLQNAFESDTANKMLALYGLAMLNAPVLLDLQNYAKLEDLSVRDTAYVALGLAALGETHRAKELYSNRIVPHIQVIAPYSRIGTGTNRAEILDATSVVSLLAAKLNMPEALALHNYAARHHTCHLTLNLERLAFITHEIENHTDTPASITYTLFGEKVTRDLSNGRQFTLRIPAQNMYQFNLTSITGSVGAVSIIRTPLEDIEPVDNDIVIRREFFKAGTNTRANTFNQDDLVRVQISIDYSRRDISGSYVITDFLPAGLTLVENSARFGTRDNAYRQWRHATTEGQRVTFFDFNGRFDRVNVYYYYARVINPGTFRAEGTLVQSIGVRAYLSAGEDAIITVRD